MWLPDEHSFAKRLCLWLKHQETNIYQANTGSCMMSISGKSYVLLWTIHPYHRSEWHEKSLLFAQVKDIYFAETSSRIKVRVFNLKQLMNWGLISICHREVSNELFNKSVTLVLLSLTFEVHKNPVSIVNHNGMQDHRKFPNSRPVWKKHRSSIVQILLSFANYFVCPNLNHT